MKRFRRLVCSIVGHSEALYTEIVRWTDEFGTPVRTDIRTRFCVRCKTELQFWLDFKGPIERPSTCQEDDRDHKYLKNAKNPSRANVFDNVQSF